MADEWFDVRATGPLFDNRGAKAIKATRQAEHAVTFKIAKASQRHIRSIGASNFKQPTGFFSARVEIDRVADGHVVHANRVIYGPWLEGTSSRNRTTRFKGYQLFRRAAQDVEANLGRILNPEERSLVKAMNGRGVVGVRIGPVI